MLFQRLLPSKKQASIDEWTPWNKAFGNLKDEFKNGAKVLNSIKELLSQGETTIFCINFRGVTVRSGLLDVLGMFFENTGDVNGNLRHLSPYMRDMVLKELRALLLDMERVPYSELIEHEMLCWRDMISDLAALGMPINSLADGLEKLCNTMFGFHLEKNKNILGQFAKVREIKRAFKLKRKKLEDD